MKGWKIYTIQIQNKATAAILTPGNYQVNVWQYQTIAKQGKISGIKKDIR